jgi:SAM-dependent MidA family methyltransferase
MNGLILQIQEEINRHGPISFARFMERALYAPGLGYYERQREIGRRGDFFTSVSTGPLFGELLGFQFAQWLGLDGPFDPFRPFEKLQIVEAGAHQGTLAADILAWMQRRRPELFARLEYCLIEPSPTRRKWQEQTLRDWLPKIKWTADVAEAGSAPANRIIFCNEFLDAMPSIASLGMPPKKNGTNAMWPASTASLSGAKPPRRRNWRSVCRALARTWRPSCPPDLSSSIPHPPWLGGKKPLKR